MYASSDIQAVRMTTNKKTRTARPIKRFSCWNFFCFVSVLVSLIIFPYGWIVHCARKIQKNTRKNCSIRYNEKNMIMEPSNHFQEDGKTWSWQLRTRLRNRVCWQPCGNCRAPFCIAGWWGLQYHDEPIHRYRRQFHSLTSPLDDVVARWKGPKQCWNRHVRLPVLCWQCFPDRWSAWNEFRNWQIAPGGVAGAAITNVEIIAGDGMPVIRGFPYEAIWWRQAPSVPQASG